MDIMFDQQYPVLGDEVPIKLGFKDVIFVMEDVDAASKVVHRRDGKTTALVSSDVFLLTATSGVGSHTLILAMPSIS